MRVNLAQRVGHIVGQEGDFDLYRSEPLSFRGTPRNPRRPFGVPQGDSKAQRFRFSPREDVAFVAGCDFLVGVLSWFSAAS